MGRGTRTLALLYLLTVTAALADSPRIAIIIDDLGHAPADARRVAALPGDVACAVLPDAPHAAASATACHRAGKTVMLHLPMEAGAGAPQEAERLVPGMGRAALRARVHAQLERVPHARGVNNHMGSGLTRNLAYMHWVMDALADRGLFFVDSRTTPASVALRVAEARGVPAARRDVFLDNERDEAAIEARILELAGAARVRGTAIAIGHPYPETLAVLERVLPELAAGGIILVSPAELAGASRTEPEAWHAYSSR